MQTIAPLSHPQRAALLCLAAGRRSIKNIGGVAIARALDRRGLAFIRGRWVYVTRLGLSMVGRPGAERGS
jgi:hypothetical protein